MPFSFESLFEKHWRDVVEILLLWIVIYTAWSRLRATRPAFVIGLVTLLGSLILFLSEYLHLPVLEWLIRNLTNLALFTLIVIFQPELRRVAIHFGNNPLFGIASASTEIVDSLGEMTFELTNRQLGALIAIERSIPLDSWISSGVDLDSKFSVELGVTLFHPKTPLHDGGLVIRGERMVAGACIFPVSQRVDLDRNLGLRHRAGIGLTEETDAIVIVASEETGTVSICHNGLIERGFSPKQFKTRLAELLSTTPDETQSS